MKTLKIAALAISALVLSSAAFAGGGHDRGWGHKRHSHNHRYETRRVIIVEPRHEQRCGRQERVVYVPAKSHRHEHARVVVRPSIQVQLAWGF